MTQDSLTDVEMTALNFIEQFVLMYDRFPPVERIQQYAPGFSPARSYTKTRFLNALHNRGLPAPPVEKKFSERLEGIPHEGFSPLQVACVVALTDFFDLRTDAAKLKQYGCTTAQFNGWMRDKDFKYFFNLMSKKHFEESDHIARKGLIKGMEKGDLPAIKYYNELTGEAPENKNIQVLLSRLVEAIQLHVKDPATLYKIEQSFAQIMGKSQAIDAEIVPSPVKEIEEALRDL